MTSLSSDISLRRVATNGIEVNAAIAGYGPAVLLLHGFPHTWRLCGHIIPLHAPTELVSLFGDFSPTTTRPRDEKGAPTNRAPNRATSVRGSLGGIRAYPPIAR